MLLSDYHYDLPANLIAQSPLADRSASRMLVVDRLANSFADNAFVDLPSLLKPGDTLVVNNTRVFPARLIGRSETGAKVEVFLIEEREPNVWAALAKPARRLKPGKWIIFDDRLSAEVVERSTDGKVLVQFRSSAEFDALIDEIGRTPLPPYIHRDETVPDNDRERYQTVFARSRGAIAAPTAGLHFTGAVLEKLAEMRIRVAEITLHVGYGTFEPVRAADLGRHKVAAERFEIGARAAELLERTRRSGGRLIAVGTTTTRALEYTLATHGNFVAAEGSADLTITPGYKFAAIDGLLTNFHLPQSSLLILVATFGGYQLIMEAYRHAVSSKYRFYSYGDCMLIT